MQIKSKRMAVIAAVSGACLAAATLMPLAATAATTTYTLSKGGTIKAAQSGSLVFVDTTSTSKPKLTCTKFVGSGTAKNGKHKFVPASYTSAKGLDPAGTLTKQSLTGCTNSVVGAVTIKPSASWSLGLSSTTKTGAIGYLYNVTATVSAAGCVFVSTGAVYGSYTNKTGIFAGTTKAGLVLSKVTGSTCSLVGVKNGDKAYLSGKVKLTPAVQVK